MHAIIGSATKLRSIPAANVVELADVSNERQKAQRFKSQKNKTGAPAASRTVTPPPTLDRPGCFSRAHVCRKYLGPKTALNFLFIVAAGHQLMARATVDPRQSVRRNASLW
jgi:hypothetical protein